MKVMLIFGITGLIALASEGVPLEGGMLVEIKGYIREKSAVRLIHSLNNRLLIARIKQKVKEASNLNETQKGRIDETHFIDVYKDLATRPEIYF
uniref:Uncharacterized protein n=1 Tax=Meloidogyne javanica TaxID=6303 RepID=A0A915MP55_MELJA